MDAGSTHSIANLANEEWTITNAEHNVVTVDLWLDAALTRHREGLAGVTDQDVTVSYQVGGESIDVDVQQVRSAMVWLNEAYRTAKVYDVTTRPERYALLQRLADERVTPSEMAVMLSVDLTVAQRFAGDDTEARIARSILHQLKTT